MNDTPMTQDARQRRLQEERGKLQREEQEKSMLYDKSIGGKDAPRPSDAFIQQCVGAPRSEAEINMQANINLEKQLRKERAEAQQRETVKKSMEAHNERIQQQERAAEHIEKRRSERSEQSARSRPRNLDRDYE